MSVRCGPPQAWKTHSSVESGKQRKNTVLPKYFPSFVVNDEGKERCQVGCLEPKTERQIHEFKSESKSITDYCIAILLPDGFMLLL